MIFILVLTLIILILIYRKQLYRPSMIGNSTHEPFIDPYSLELHQIASDKADWWNKTHGRTLYYMHNQVPQHYKE